MPGMIREGDRELPRRQRGCRRYPCQTAVENGIPRAGPGHDVQAIADAGFGKDLASNLDWGPRGGVDYASKEPELWMRNAPGYSVQEGHAVASVDGNSRQLNRGYCHTCLNQSRKDGFYEVVIWPYPALPEENGLIFREAVAGLIIDGASQPLTITHRTPRWITSWSHYPSASTVTPNKPTNTFDATRDLSPSLDDVFFQRQIDMDQGSNILGQVLRHMNASAIATFSTGMSAKYFRLTASGPGWLSSVEIPSGPCLPAWNYKAHWVSAIAVQAFIGIGFDSPALYWWPLDGCVRLLALTGRVVEPAEVEKFLLHNLRLWVGMGTAKIFYGFYKPVLHELSLEQCRALWGWTFWFPTVRRLGLMLPMESSGPCKHMRVIDCYNLLPLIRILPGEEDHVSPGDDGSVGVARQHRGSICLQDGPGIFVGYTRLQQEVPVTE
ncbi:hypothetical protein IW261DRAFT_1416358 [Armillaria novae-zelandiae]|uniref:Uncharacterized protein n=1 Tax=Armillaria novae-zelandiae TaxID=153914 RepID=A0AA39PN35_9AGAR|nr:hypothetical protein IW261DRAFT_1416358 [Armillaria novae-zelandiae]